MSSPVQKLRQAEAALKAAQAQLAALQEDPELQRFQDFEKKLRHLMAEHNMSLVDINTLLDDNYKAPKPKSAATDATPAKPAGKKPAKPRATRTYKNPHTGEQITHTSGANKTLNLWREQYGYEVVKSWSVLNNR